MHQEATGHPGPEAIVAFIDGSVSPEVESHIRGCATCSAEATALQTAQKRLRHTLHRFDCPDPHRLGEYELGLLATDERVQIANHALDCQMCTEELQMLRGFLALESPSVPEGLAAQIRRVVATLLAPSPTFSLGGVRGAETQLRQYEVDDARLSIGPGPEPGSLIGLLVLNSGAQVGTAEARLLPDHGEPYVTEVDDLGNFEFEQVRPGTYVLEIQLPHEIIVVQQLAVGLSNA